MRPSGSHRLGGSASIFCISSTTFSITRSIASTTRRFAESCNPSWSAWWEVLPPLRNARSICGRSRTCYQYGRRKHTIQETTSTSSVKLPETPHLVKISEKRMRQERRSKVLRTEVRKLHRTLCLRCMVTHPLLGSTYPPETSCHTLFQTPPGL